MKCALADLIKWAQFQFSTSKLITHDAVRIKPLLKNFLRDGKLTREPARQKQWVGCVLIRIMVTSVLNDAMSNGTANWDITVSGVLSTEQMYLGDDNAPFPKNISTLAKLCPKLTFIKGFVKQQHISRIDCHLCLCSVKANRVLKYHRYFQEKSGSALDDAADILIGPMGILGTGYTPTRARESVQLPLRG